MTFGQDRPVHFPLPDETGGGISILSPLATRRERRHGLLECAPVGEGRIRRELNIIHAPGADLKFAESFLDFCREKTAAAD